MEGSAEARALTDQASQWAAQYRQCIEAVFVDYVHSGAWPNVQEFQQRLHVAGSDLDLWPFADALRHNRRWLGWVEPPDERIELRLRAWHGLRGSAGEYARFVVSAVRTAVDRYRANKSVLSANDLRTQSSGPIVTNEFTWKLLMGLLEQESFYFLQPGPLTTSLDWERPIDIRRIGQFLKVQTVEDYLLVTAQLHVDGQPWFWRAQPGSSPTVSLLSHRLEVPTVTHIITSTPPPWSTSTRRPLT